MGSSLVTLRYAKSSESSRLFSLSVIIAPSILAFLLKVPSMMKSNGVKCFSSKKLLLNKPKRYSLRKQSQK